MEKENTEKRLDDLEDDLLLIKFLMKCVVNQLAEKGYIDKRELLEEARSCLEKV